MIDLTRIKNADTEKMQKILPFFVLLIITIISFIKYANFSFDLDEIFAIDSSERINDLKYFKYLDSDLGNPPLFFFLIKPFVEISRTEIWLRILPMIFYLIAVIAMSKNLEQLKLDPKLSLGLMIIFLGLSPYWYLRFYVRAYSLLLLLVLLTIYLTFKIIEKSRIRDSIKLGLIAAIGFNSHYIYWIFCGMWLISYLTISIKNEVNKRTNFLTISGLVGGIMASIPLIINLIGREIFTEDKKYYWWQVENKVLSFTSWWEILLKINLDNTFKDLLGISMWLILFFLIIFTIRKKINIKQKILLFFTEFFWLTYLLTPLRSYFSPLKYTAVFLLFIPISIVITIDNSSLFKKNLNNKLFKFVFVVIALIWALIIPSQKYKFEGGDNWKEAIESILSYEQNYSIVTDCLDAPAFYNYLGKDIKLYGFDKLYSKNDCGLDSITDKSADLKDITLITGGEHPKIPIEQTHEIAGVNKKYWPIIITYYRKK